MVDRSEYQDLIGRIVFTLVIRFDDYRHENMTNLCSSFATVSSVCGLGFNISPCEHDICSPLSAVLTHGRTHRRDL